MKSRYHKLINIIFALTLCLGVGMLGIVPPGEKYTTNASDSSYTMKQISEEQSSEEGSNIAAASSLEAPTATPTPIPTPTPFPVYPLEDKDYPKEIDTFIETYYKAKLSSDTDKLKSISTHPEAVVEEKDLKRLVDGIDEYLNIKCYVKRTYQEDFYIVWVYYDIKFIGLDTYAPSLAKLYVQKTSDGQFKSFDGELDEAMKAYSEARNEDKDVMDLKIHTETLAEEARAEDKALRDYWELRGQR